MRYQGVIANANHWCAFGPTDWPHPVDFRVRFPAAVGGLVRRTPFRVGHGWRDQPTLALVDLEPMQKEMKWRR